MSRERRKEIMRLMREDFDPTPAGWEGRDWNDNAEDVAMKIEALFTSQVSDALGPYWSQWLDHWKARAEKAEKERDTLRAALERRGEIVFGREGD